MICGNTDPETRVELSIYDKLLKIVASFGMWFGGGIVVLLFSEVGVLTSESSIWLSIYNELGGENLVFFLFLL